LNNLAEKTLLEDPVIREAAAAENLALIWIGTGPRGRPFNRGFKSKDDDALLNEMLSELAKESGYSELAAAPLLSIGHSAGVPFAWELAKSHPDRMIGVVPFKSWLPEMPKADEHSAVESVPMLVVKAQFEEWSQPGGPTDRQASWRNLRLNALGYRAQSDRNLTGYLLDVGGGHFESSREMTRILAMFIRKASQMRIPADTAGDGRVTLKSIAPEDGWLTDSGVGMEPDQPVVVAYKDFTGDRRKAFWYFDRELAEAVRNYGADQKGKTDQMVTFSKNGEAVPLSKRGIVETPFQPLEDGRTFKLGGDFFAVAPEGVIGQGQPLGHGDGPVGMRVTKGPARQSAPDTFRIQFDRAGFSSELWLLAYHPGDVKFRRAVQAGLIVVPRKNTKGKPQSVTFPEIPDQPAGTAELGLKATTDSDLPAEYYVQTGPAEIVGSKLEFTPLPPRTRYPVKVTVVAYQWGRNIEPFYQSAEPVTRTFNLLGK
jgi:pimeloyl-ACP methyl ester carboxylesterase